jgi:hypothetical protein
MNAEISFDLIQTDDMVWDEGAFRLDGGPWQVYIFSSSDLSEPRIKAATWGSGIAGVHVEFPKSLRLHKEVVKAIFGRPFGRS